MKSHSDALYKQLFAHPEMMRQTDMQAARDSLTRWVLSTLQDEFSGTTLPESSREEAPIMLFNKRFKHYEDLLEYEAIQKGRKVGRKEGRQEGQRLALLGVLQALLAKAGDSVPADAAAIIATADAEQLSGWVKSLLDGVTPAQIFSRS